MRGFDCALMAHTLSQMSEPENCLTADANRVLAVFASAREEGRQVPDEVLDLLEKHQMQDTWLTVQDDPWWEPS